MLKLLKKYGEKIFVGILIVGSVVFMLVMFVEEKTPSRLYVTEEGLRIDAGFYGDFYLDLSEAEIFLDDEPIVVIKGQEVYMKNNKKSAAGTARIEKYPDFNVFLGVRNKKALHIVIYIFRGEDNLNYFLVNEKNDAKTIQLYEQLLEKISD